MLHYHILTESLTHFLELGIEILDRGGLALNDKCSLDKLAEAPGSRQLDVGQGKNHHHSQEKEENIEHCPHHTKE